MNGPRRTARVLSAAILLGLAGCSTTSIKAVWIDESYQGGPLEKVLVIGVSEKPVVRRSFEDEFVRQLESRGTEAIASYRLFPEAQKLDKDTVLSRIEADKADAVLITRLVDRRYEATYYPGEVYVAPHRYSRHWYDYYSWSYGSIYSPGYVVESEVVRLETNIYDIKTEDLIWSALSETFVYTDEKRLIRSIIHALVNKLAKDGLVKKAKD